MAIRINEQTYYRTSEACQRAGISRATLFRWFKVGILENIIRRDRKGWRLFTQDDINRIKSEATRVGHGETLFKETRKGAS